MRMVPVSVNISPIGMRRSRVMAPPFASGEENVDGYGPDQDGRRQRLGALPPLEMSMRRLGRERMDQSHQLLFGMRLGEQAHQHGYNKVGAEGVDGSVEILRHVAWI